MRRAPALLVLALAAAGCGAAPPAAPAPEPAAGPPPAPAAVRPDASCAERARRALDGGRGAGLGLALDAAAPDAVDNDLALPRAGGDDAAPCVLRVGAPRPLPTAAAVVLAREPATGRHAAGERTRRNPEHERLSRELRAAERARVGTVDLHRSGEPMADLLGGLVELGVAGAELLTREAKVARLRAELAATPESLTVPREQAYRYALLTVAARRAAELPLALVDRRGGAVRAALSRVEESRRLRVAEGRRGDDLAAPPAEVLDGLAAVEAWRRRGPPLRVSDALAHLLEVGAVAAGGAPAMPGPAVPEPAAGPAAWPGLLTLRGAAGTTLAVRIAPGLLAADAQALGRSDLGEVVDEQGRRGLALVRARAAAGVARLATSLAGPPAALAEPGPGPARLVALDAAGGRVVHDGQLVADLDGGLLWSGAPDAGAVLVGEAVVGLVADGAARLVPLGEPPRAGLSAGRATPPPPGPASP